MVGIDTAVAARAIAFELRERQRRVAINEEEEAMDGYRTARVEFEAGERITGAVERGATSKRP